jgi:hypothetical protein
VTLGVGPGVAAAAKSVDHLVYTGAGTAQISQYIDHTKTDVKANWDVYSKHVKWTVTWKLTFENGVLESIGEPHAKVSGNARALIRSRPVDSCSGSVSLPFADSPGKPRTYYAPMSLIVESTTRSWLSMRIDNASPLYWAVSPTCASGAVNSVDVATNGDHASVLWFNSWEQPEFDLARHNGLRPRPQSLGGRFHFAPVGIQRQVTWNWHARLRVKVG